MTTDAKLLLAALCLILLSPTSCRREALSEAKLDDATLARHATIGPFQARTARVLNDNDAAFAQKLRLVEGARSSIDMLYYVYHDDYSSAVFSRALLAATARGVAVRLLVDYNKSYKYLDYYTMLERQAASGPGSLQVRLFNRPTRRLIEDAVYMTIGCSEVLAEAGGDCEERKFDFIERAFAEEGNPGNISNLNLANSGLFLSGLYGLRPGVMALAVIEGQNLDLEALKASAQGSGERIESVKRLAGIYWRSRRGPLLSRIVNKFKLALAYLHYGSEIRQLRETVTSLLPVGRSAERGGWQDWEYQTDYLHHKILLIDGEKLLIGGRNIGDQYHMRPNSLLEGKLSFADTEVYVEPAGDVGREFRQTFDQLWDFRQMVAATEEVRQHAPNDFIANHDAFEAAGSACAGAPEAEREACVDREFAAGASSLEEREAARREEMSVLAAEYESGYTPAPMPAPFPVDPGAQMYYLENVPFDKNLAPAERTRLVGGKGLKEDATGKYLHLLWRRSLTNACTGSSAEAPKRVILLNAYFLPPAALLRAAGWMIDGSLDCRHVRVQVLSNSMATNNLKAVNPPAHLGLKAFSDFYHRHGDPDKRARFEFYEYRVLPENPSFTLHSKVAILGDDVLIGSANLDVRSYMMDTNNGILIRGAPGLRASYTAFVDAQLADPRTVTDLGEYIRSTSRQDLKFEELRRLREYVGSFGISEQLSAEQQALLEGLFAKILDQAYDLTGAVLRGDEEAIDRYNRLFKLL